LLSRTLISPSGRLATSTQLLNELLELDFFHSGIGCSC